MSRAGLVTQPIDVNAIVQEVRRANGDTFGAIATFIGTVRNTDTSRDTSRAVAGLEYSAYDTMAAKEMDDILREALALAEGSEIIAVHRTGSLAVGDVCVMIAAAHAHRAPAFDACRYVIEEIKKRVPIWKRERFTDGSAEWVNAHSSPRDSSSAT
jgi:molybdopterin synthase catalytic subunit